MAATRFLTYYVPITVYNSLAICINASLGLVKSCLRQLLIVLVYSWLRGTTIKTVLWLAKASYLVFALSGLMPFSYHLLLRAHIEALIVSVACLFILLTSNLKHCYKACIWLLKALLADISL